MHTSRAATLTNQLLVAGATTDGVLTANDLAGLLISRSELDTLLASGLLVREARGLYRLGCATSWSTDLRVALARSGGWASHETAARLWGFDGAAERPLHLTVTRSGRAVPARPDEVVHTVLQIPKSHVGTKDGLRVTSAQRTALDLAARPLPDETLLDFLGHLVATRVTDATRLEAFLRRQPKHTRGARRLRRLGAELGGGVVESVFEARLLRRLVEAGLPRPALQFEVVVDGRLAARADFAWPDERVILEADGYRYHSDPESFERDRTRRNALELAGWRVLNVTPRRLADDPAAVCREVAEALGRSAARAGSARPLPVRAPATQVLQLAG